MSFKVTIPSWLRTWAAQPVDPTPVEDNRVDMSWVDRMTPFEAPLSDPRPPDPRPPDPRPPDPRPPVPSAQIRLAEVELLLAGFAKSEGRAPSGTVLQQVSDLIDRLHEQDKQSI